MVSAKHRVQMARLAVSSLPWAVVDDWESLQHDAVPSFQVAQRVKDGTNWLADVVHVFFVCGQDMFVAMRNPNIWPAVNVSRLRRIVRFAVHARPDVEGGCEAWRGAVVLKGWVGDLSSTVVR